MGQLCKEECSNTGPDIYSFIVYGLDFGAAVKVPNSSDQIAHGRHSKLLLIFGKTFLLKVKLAFEFVPEIFAVFLKKSIVHLPTQHCFTIDKAV